MLRKIRFWWTASRIGPDMVLTHWMLHFPATMRWLAKRKLGAFGMSSDIRPFSYLMESYNIFIGERTVLRQCMLQADQFASIRIGSDVLIGANLHVYVNDHKFDDLDKTIEEQGYYPSEGVTIEDNVWIGANVTILSGVTVGTQSVVGAGSVVTRDVEPCSVYVGVPAKKVKDLH